MVEFGGFMMPVQYADLSIKDSHLWTREKASLFDVSHMYALYFFMEDQSVDITCTGFSTNSQGRAQHTS
jgi:glycine cleavage system aminomethyltransferase T